MKKRILGIGLALMLLTVSASAAVLTDAPGTPTQDRAVALDARWEDEARTAYDLRELPADHLTVNQAVDVYDFVYEQGNRPVRWYPEDTQKAIEAIISVDPDTLHMTEFMRLYAAEIVPPADLEATMTLTIDYQPGQLTVVVLGDTSDPANLVWTPVKSRVTANGQVEFNVPQALMAQLQGEDFTQMYLDEELQLAEQMFPPPEAEEVKRLLQSRAELSDVRRAAAIYKLQRYSYNGNGDSYGVSSCDIQRFFRDIWECSHRLKDVALENKDFESIITTHNDPQTTVYCDPPYYEAERYAVEFPRSDHQRLHDVLAQHRGFAMVSYNNCDYIRRLYEDFFIYEVERPNSQSKKKNDIYREYIMTNYDPRVFASQMTIFGDYSSDGKICRLVHIPERPLRT